MVVGGRSARIVSNIDLGKGIDVLVLDTDSRTERNFSNMNVLTVGSRIVHGEGSGGNMNLARACFRMDMEQIAPRVLGRPLVVFLTVTDGATGMAGAVEMSSLLVKVGMASFSFLLHEEGIPGGRLDPLRIASILLDGPLKPGCILTAMNAPGSSPEDPFGLQMVLPYILRSALGGEGYAAPQSVWQVFREDGGPFEVGPLNIPDTPQQMKFSPPALVSLSVPEGMTNQEVRSRLGSAFGQMEGVHLALIPSRDGKELEGAFISRSSQKQGPQEGPPIDPETLKDLVGEPDAIDIQPSIKIMGG